MSIQVIKMPDIGEGIAEVEIVEWHIAQNDTVTEDQVLVDVMTDKASVEIPSPVAGKVVRLGGDVGDTLAVGAELLAIEPAAAGAATSTQAVARDATSAAAAAAPSAQAQSQAVDSAPSQPSPRSGMAGVLASPSVRHRARQLGVDLTDLGLPADTVVSHSDLDKHLLQHHLPAAQAESASSVQGTSVRHDVTAPSMALAESDHGSEGDEQAIRLSGLRRQIASKMQTSYRHIPHFSYVEEVDVTELEALREQLNASAHPDQPRLTVLPFIIRAIVLALRKYPELNARFDEQEGVIHQSAAVHLGMATQTDKGLMVPVLHHAQRLDLWQCAEQVASMAALARRGRASRDQLVGSTITLTSLGALGGVASTPIINHPEVAIVGVNRIVERLVPQGGSAVARKMMNLSSSFDHRIIDGMQAAQFIQEVRRGLECPALLFIDGSA